MPLNSRRALYISYNGAMEEIVPSQVVPYLAELAKDGYKFTLLTFEKRQDVIKAGPEGMRRLKNRLKAAGINWRCLRYHKRFPLAATSFDILAGAVCALYLVIAGKICVVHARSVIPAVMSLAPKLLLGTKFIFDTRGLLAEEYAGGGHWREGCLEYRAVKFFEKLCLKLADAVVVLTSRHHKYLSGMPWLKSRKKNALAEVIPCCVDLNRFGYDPGVKRLLREKEGLRGSFVFAYLGKIGKHYMLEEMLDFFVNASRKLPNSKFMFISQSGADGICAAARLRGLASDKIIIRKPFYEEIPGLVAIADAGIFFINPYKKFASSPIKLGEFLSCGVPIIINSGIGDTEEFVRQNNVGVSISGFSSGDYERGLSEFLELFRQGDALCLRCRQTAEKYLSLRLGAKKYNTIYSKLR